MNDLNPLEIILNPNGTARQAGTTDSDDGAWIDEVRVAAERDLFFFGRYIMGFELLTEHLHHPICAWLQQVPPIRKMLLLPRDHLKTTIVGRCLPIHILVQPKEHNLYLPGCYNKVCFERRTREATGESCDNLSHRKEGRNTRILLAYEIADNAEAQLMTIAHDIMGGNPLLRALWPSHWPTDPKDAQKWNERRIVIQRTENYPQPSIDTAGIGAATTGRHYDIHILDDICAKKAADSPTEMENGKKWHAASRAMLDWQDRSPEFIIGTHWAVSDLYGDIKEKDGTVEHITRSLVEDGKIIFPEHFDLSKIAEMRRLYGTLFPLMYMNDPSSPELVDFDMSMIRSFTVKDGLVVFTCDPRDAVLGSLYSPNVNSPSSPTPLHDSAYIPGDAEQGSELRRFGRDEFLAYKHAAYIRHPH